MGSSRAARQHESVRHSELAKFASLPSSRMSGTPHVVFAGVPIDAGRPPILGGRGSAVTGPTNKAPADDPARERWLSRRWDGNA